MQNKTLTLDQIQNHWKYWANKFGTDLRATTKSSTAKQIEIHSLIKTVLSIKNTLPTGSKVLEIGCGNGHNLLSLYKAFPEFLYSGIDFIDEMILSANKNMAYLNIPSERIKFAFGNVLELDDDFHNLDLIFTVRCLINLNSDQLQLEAINNISKRLKPGGHFIMIENSYDSYDNQNNLRHLVGLQKRTPANFNHFINDAHLIKNATNLGLSLLRNENITSLHDLLLYVLVPMINNGEVDYHHPIVNAAANLSISISNEGDELFGNYGQNKLYLFKKV